jgi:protein phosphatase
VEKQSTTDTDEFPPLLPQQDGGPASISSLVEVDLGALSHPGKVRTNNEDHYFVARFDRSMRPLLTNLSLVDLPDSTTEAAYGLLVADGMGGHAAGEVASRTAISVLVDLVLRSPDWIMRLDEQGIQMVLRRMEQRLRQVQLALAERARADARLSGMGTTLTLACSFGADLLLAHVGDSRAYLHRRGQLRQLTRDQTVAQELLDSGAIRPEEAATSPLRHVLTGALAATGSKVRVELNPWRLADGDQLLLCTDGLTDMVPNAAVAEALRQPGSAADACRTLVDLALEAGGKDNVTAVLCRYHIPAAAK